MAVTNEQVSNWLRANPNATDAEIAKAAADAGVSAQQLSDVTGVPVQQVVARVAAAAPAVQLPVAAPETSWNYNQYYESLKSESTNFNAALGNVGGVMGQNAQNIYNEILAQQKAGSAEYWYKGNTASKEAAAADFALRLAENGISSLNDVAQKQVQGVADEGGMAPPTTVLINKQTGEALPRADLLGRGNKGLDIDYNLHFTEDGSVIPYTSNRTSDWVNFREGVVKPAAGILLAAYGVPYVSTALAGTTVGGVTLATGSAALTGVSAGIVSGGVSLVSGNSFEDALKSALTSGLTAGASAGYADTIGQSLGFDAGSVASKAAGQAIIAGAKAGITDENVLANMATAAVATYLSNKEPTFDATEREGSLAKPGIDDTMTTDFGVNADYSLTGGLKFGSTEGIKVDDRGVSEGFDLTGGSTPFTGLQTPTSPSLTAMGGGQGLTATKPDGATLAGTDFTTGPSIKDIKTGAKVAGVLLAGNEVVNKTIGLGGPTTTQKQDIYRDAPLAGFKMVKYEDPATGGSKYIPFVGDEALLPPPSGYNRTSFAKGGFVSRR